jgi:hypothetical protein
MKSVACCSVFALQGNPESHYWVGTLRAAALAKVVIGDGRELARVVVNTTASRSVPRDVWGKPCGGDRKIVSGKLGWCW